MRVQLRRLGPQPQIKELPLTGKDSTWVAGRGSNADIYTLSRFASRVHFSIIYKRKKFYIFDHGSSNGTFINDQRIVSLQEYDLPLNSIISVGVMSVHQNEPDCIVLVFEQCKEERAAITVECHTEEEEIKAKRSNFIDLETTRTETDNDEDKKQQNRMIVESKPFNGNQGVASRKEFKTEKKIILDHSNLNKNQKSNSDQNIEEEDVIIIKPEPVDEIPSTSEVNEIEMIEIKKEHNYKEVLDNSDIVILDKEKDLFEPEEYADDEIVHAFQAQTQEETLTRNSQMSYSMTEDFIEISDSEDDMVNNIKIEDGNISFIKPELIDLGDYDDEIICLDIIKSNKENHPITPVIKIEDDDVFTETDKKWFGKLFKTEEECCSFIQSQRESAESEKIGVNNREWIDFVNSCAEEIEQILLAEDKEKDEQDKIKVIDKEKDYTIKENVPLDKTARDHGNSSVVEGLTSPPENKKEVTVKLKASSENVKKRSSSKSSEDKTSKKPKRIKLVEPSELKDEGNLRKRRKKQSEQNLSSGKVNKSPINGIQSKVTKIFRDSKPKPGISSTGKTKKKVNAFPASERKIIRDQRRKRLKELSSREPPKEGKTVQAPKALPPLKVKITRKNRSEYLCHQITGENNSEINSGKRSGGLEKTGGKLDSIVNENEPISQNINQKISSAKYSFLENVQLKADSEKIQVSKDRVLSHGLVVKEVENCKSVNHASGQVVKSCLKKFGYAFLKSNKPLVSLKSVRFQGAPTVRYYETEYRISRKTSSLTQTNKSPEVKTVGTRSIIAKICNWNAVWLEECKSALKTELPPAFLQLKNVPRKFFNHDSYMKTFVPLLLLELWHLISERWKECNNGLYRFPAVITSHSEIIGDENENLGLIRCESLAEMSFGMPFYVREGDLVMLQLTKKSGTFQNVENNSKKLVYRIFGYVQNKTVYSVDPYSIHPFLIEKCYAFQPDKIMMLEILVTYRRELFQNLSNCFQITGIYHIDSQLVQCQAVCTLIDSPMCKSILSPDHRYMSLSNDLPNETLIFNGFLSDSQRELILKLVSAGINRDNVLLQIQGGPGTGKTHILFAFILQLLFTKQWKTCSPPKILYCAHSNAVVDNMALKLKNYRQSLSQNSRYKLVRFGHLNVMKSAVRDVSSCSLGLKNDHHMDIMNKTKALNREIDILVTDLQSSKTLGKCEADEKSSRLHAYVREREMLKNLKPAYISGQKPSYASECAILENADVICTTCIGSGTKIMLDAFKKIKRKDPNQKIICIVDNAMQSKESETIVPLQLGVTHLILAGDSRQLRSPSRSELAQSLGLNQSLFWRISSIFRLMNDGLPPIVKLETQYRMNCAISAFPNKIFYNNTLKDGSKNLKKCNIDDYAVLIDNVLIDSSQEEQENRLYAIAVKLICEVMNTMADNISQGNFGIITCRFDQSKNLKEELNKKLDEDKLSKIEVNIIENVQGQEFEIVLFIFDISLDCAARANVALTRAKNSLIILTSNPTYTNNKLLSKLTDEAVIRGTFSQVNSFMDGQHLRKIISKNSAYSY